MSYSDPSGEVLKDEPEATQDKTTDEIPQEKETTKFTKVDYKKRYDDVKSHYDKKLIEWRAKEEQLKAQIASSAPTRVPKTPEELATFKNDYPDVYDVVESVAHRQAEEQLEKVKAEIAQLKEKEAEYAMREARLILGNLQPDYDEIVESVEFHEWAANQPDQIQSWIYENPDNATLASRAIDLYKKDAGLFSDKKEAKQSKTKKSEPDAAEAVMIKDQVDPSAGEKKIWKASEIESLSMAQYEKYAEEIDLAFKEKRIVQG